MTNPTFVTRGLLLMALLVCQPFRVAVIVGRSMEPTLHNASLQLVDTRYARGHGVQRGDVVVVRHDGDTLVKRVYAVGGDWLREVPAPETDDGPAYLLGPQRVPADHLYLLGDNTRVSLDSRTFGPVPEGEVIGKLVGPPRITPPQQGGERILSTRF